MGKGAFEIPAGQFTVCDEIVISVPAVVDQACSHSRELRSDREPGMMCDVFHRSVPSEDLGNGMGTVLSKKQAHNSIS